MNERLPSTPNQEALPPLLLERLNKILAARQSVDREHRGSHEAVEEGVSRLGALRRTIVTDFPDRHPDILLYLLEHDNRDIDVSDVPDVDFNTIAHELIKRRGIGALAKSIEIFPSGYQDAYGTKEPPPQLELSIAHALIDAGYAEAFTEGYDRFKEADMKMVDAMIGAEAKQTNYRSISRFIYLCERFPHLDRKDIGEKLMDVGFGKEVLLSNEFPGMPREKLVQSMEAIIASIYEFGHERLAGAIAANGQYTPVLSEKLAVFASIAGTTPSAELFVRYRDGEFSAEELQRGMEDVRTILEHGGAAELASIESNLLLRELFTSYLRIDTSEWGGNEDDETTGTEAVIQRYLQNKESYAPLPEGYATVEVEVAKVDRKVGREVKEYMPEFKERWPVLIDALLEAHRYAWDDKPLALLMEQFETIRTGIIEERRANVEKQKGNAKAFEHAEKALGVAESVAPTVRGLAQAFQTVFDSKKTKELNKTLLVFGFALAMRQNNLRDNWYSINDAEPSIEEISRVLNFVTHIAHQETWEKSKRFADKKSREKLNQLFNVKALEDQLTKMQQGAKASKETARLTIRPSRDILTEFSGHMADACWASRQEILARPNISSLSFFMDGKVAGACLLIDAEAKQGIGASERMTIIRGLNPLESVINKLDQESFVKAVVEYVGKVANGRRRNLAIVIDEHAGGSSTNRPLLFNYLRGLKHALTPVRGLSSRDTVFNDYDITRTTYYIRPAIFEPKT